MKISKFQQEVVLGEISPGKKIAEDGHLSGLFERHNTLMPHQLAVETGCSLEEATRYLVRMVAIGKAQLHILVYHSCDPDIAIAVIPASDDSDRFPLQCDNCGNMVQGGDVSHGLIFKLLKENL